MSNERTFKILDCTLRDGGYYNNWNFSDELIENYVRASLAAKIDVIEIGFRSSLNNKFKGACAYSSDLFLENLPFLNGTDIAVMVNGSEICRTDSIPRLLEKLFPKPAISSIVSIVRIACHFSELSRVLSATRWLADHGYKICINIMQISDRKYADIKEITSMASDCPIDVLYFADSTGSLKPDDISRIVEWFRTGWQRELGIHTHNNMGIALQNTLRAYEEGVNWLDSTVSGMGRGPGNAKTEELVIETETLRDGNVNYVPLMALSRQKFDKLKAQYGWGPHPYYYLSGKYGIHPSYIQEMINDARYDDEDIIAVTNQLKSEGGKVFSLDSLDLARQFYIDKANGSWSPTEIFNGREVLILGSGPGVREHSSALELYIQKQSPLVLALNTQSAIDSSLIDLRIACHPVRLIADVEEYNQLAEPLIIPVSSLPKSLRNELANKKVFDYGLGISANKFQCNNTYCIIPSPLVLAYALAVATSGKSKNILLAGFDGYAPGDPRNEEIENIFLTYFNSYPNALLHSITSTNFKTIASKSLYGMF
ncbi:aldolase catalytic domain-containing protein [Parasynechococcus marenigrum]|uniref:Possible HMGL-like family protein n=1 Tax=Parasynechococcus marenigrum (strain WH8102) TaxID=84588 RepID=Q7U935_PARMW|nr:aldolase catalytic domain-containing protein [Parasynechococcus marenigrum]CAE06939.1 Possible HMGL-like family protein [Parasynechococcus marenigrum WH 8102]